MLDPVRQSRDENNVRVARQVAEKPRLAGAMPNNLTIETGAVCPLRCVFCPQTDPNFDLPRDFLLLEEFKRIIDRFEGSLERVHLFNWGEPLLNPDLPHMIRHVSEKGIYSVVHSNLNFINPSLAEALVSSGLSELTASIDGASDESYAKYRVNGSFSKALSGLKMLLDARRKQGASGPKIFWQFLVFRHNEHEFDAAKQIAANLGVEIKFQFAVVTRKEFESTLEDYSGEGFLRKFVRDYDSPCLSLWRNPIVHPGGWVLPCCMISHKKYAVGNVFEEDFKNIWNNEKYQALRDIVAGRAQPAESFYCHGCIFNPVTGDRKYHEIQAS